MVREEELTNISVVFTGLFRDGISYGNLSADKKIAMIRESGVKNIYWYTWVEQPDYNSFLLQKQQLQSKGVIVREINEPFPHRTHGIEGRQRQIYNIKAALREFDHRDFVLKLRWDVDFNKELLQNISRKSFFNPIENGAIRNKIWTGFYSIQEMFSPCDTSFAGNVGDLDKLINFNFTIDGSSSNNYICHDGMTLMPFLISKNKKVCDIIKQSTPKPASLMFEMDHIENKDFINAWAYSYYLLHKYFKTGPLGSCYFKRGDTSKWPYSFVDYERFLYNKKTVVGLEPKLGLYPRYRVYDDVFIDKVVKGQFSDLFAERIYNAISQENYEI